jgi:predicted helicase
MQINGEGQWNAAFRTRRGAFRDLCRTAINPAVTPDDVDEMLIQLILTEEISISIFSDTQTLQENCVARENLRLPEDGVVAALVSNANRTPPPEE